MPFSVTVTRPAPASPSISMASSLACISASSPASAGPASSARRGSSFVSLHLSSEGSASGVGSTDRQTVGIGRGVVHGVDARAGERVHDRAHQRMVGCRRCVGPHRRRCPARRRSARPRRSDSAIVQRVPVASVSSAPRRDARSFGASGCGRSSITGGAKRTRCTEWTRCACSIASRRSATSAVTSRKLARRGAASASGTARPAHRRRPRARRRRTADGSGACRSPGRRCCSAAAPDRPATAGPTRGKGGSAPSRRRRDGPARSPPRRRPSAASARRAPAPAPTADRPAPRRACAPPRAVPGCRAATGTDFSRVTV